MTGPFIKHREMKDVCCEILKQEGWKTYLVAWWNLRGLLESKEPFLMGTTSRPCIEEIEITNKEEWVAFANVNEAAK